MSADRFVFLSLFASLSLAVSCSVVTTGLPEPTSVAERVGQFPTTGLPLRASATVRFDEHLIPFVSAQNEDDLAFLIGLTHAHLRAGQIELVRQISQGRIARLAGPFAADIDHTIRLLGFDRAVDQIWEDLPAATRAWLERYVEGLNFGLAHLKVRPHEFELLGLEPEPFDVKDILIIGRLAAADVNWLRLPALMALKDAPQWSRIFAALGDGEGLTSHPSFRADVLERTLLPYGKAGSNAFVLSGRRTSSGKPLLANDPHLGLQLPNFWVIMGWSMPGVRAVGLSIPGLPVLAVGRTEHIAWGGTNMQSASSDLVEVSTDEIVTRREPLSVRWWFDRTLELREGPEGPIISDAPLFQLGEKPLQLRWMGHRASDEITPLLRVLRVRTFDEFRAAFSSWSVSGQNFLYADADGTIGQVMAVRVPVREQALLSSVTRRDPWTDTVTATDLPAIQNPEAGYIASSNNRPASGGVPVGYAFAANDRIRRLHEILGEDVVFGPSDAMLIQRDTVIPSSRDFARWVCTRVQEPSDPVLVAICAWDGSYRRDSEGALAFELLLFHLVEAVLDPDLAPLKRLAVFRSFAIRSVKASADPATALRDAAQHAGRAFSKFGRWGQMHRLQVAHLFGPVPVLGGRYQIGNFPADGGAHSLLKSAHVLTDEKHNTTYGAQSRFIADLSDEDANWFVLLGGQDGHLRSDAFADQLPLWREGRYIKIPLRPESVQAHFTRVLRLQGDPSAPDRTVPHHDAEPAAGSP